MFNTSGVQQKQESILTQYLNELNKLNKVIHLTIFF
jgi:16S rRNA G527 N7-methylase RsmG